MALTLSRGMTQGFRPAFLSVLGNVAAGFVQVPAVVLGLASVLQASPRLFLGVKAAGGLYLAYLGIKAILRCARDAEVSLAARPGDARDAFWQGFVTNLLNPKVLLFMIAFLPQFTSPEQGPVWSQMLVLGITMKILSLPYGSCFAYGASRIRGWVGATPGSCARGEGLLGAIMLGLAAYRLPALLARAGAGLVADAGAGHHHEDPEPALAAASPTLHRRRIRGWVGRNAWFLRAARDCWVPSCWAWRHMCFTPRPRLSPDSLSSAPGYLPHATMSPLP